MTNPTYISECCGSSITGGRCSSCWEGVVGEESIPDEPTSYGQDIDTFIAEYIPEGKKNLAMLQLQLIALKANREGFTGAHASFKKALSTSSK